MARPGKEGGRSGRRPQTLAALSRGAAGGDGVSQTRLRRARRRGGPVAVDDPLGIGPIGVIVGLALADRVDPGEQGMYAGECDGHGLSGRSG